MKFKSDDASEKYQINIEELGFTASKECQTDPVEIVACPEALDKVTE